MFKNYIKIAFRNLLKNRSYMLINIAGLTLGLTSAFLIFALVRYHFNIDQHHSKVENIYRITSKFIGPDGGHTTGVPFPFGKALQTDHPNIAEVTMINEIYNPMVLIEENGKSKKIKDSNGNEKGAFVEPNFFSIFDYQWIEGGFSELSNPNTMVLSRSMANKYFGTTQCLGKIVKLEGRQIQKVVGVFEDYKDNTDFRFEIMPSYKGMKEFNGTMSESFNSTNSSSQCFVLLDNNFTKADWDKHSLNFVKKHKPEGVKDTRFVMTSVKENHFHQDLGQVSKNLILSLLLIGVFLIVTACINFINLATAQAIKRSKEVGVRKVLGSTKSQLFWQFIFETAIITLFSLVVSIVLFYISLPIIQSNLSGVFKFTFYFTPALLLYLAGIIALVILFSGAYPGIILGGFKPVMALKGKITTQELGGLSVRKSLVVTQFAISQMLIIGMFVVASQLNYFNNKDLGFKKDAIVTVALPFVDSQEITKMNTFKSLVSGLQGVEKMSYSMSGAPQTGWVNTTSIQFDNRAKEEDFGVNTKSIDDKYLDLYDIKLVAGRNIYPSDTVREYLINETLAKRLGFSNPNLIINKTIEARGKKLPIVGVVKDFHMSGLNQAIDPLFMSSDLAFCYYSNIKLTAGDIKSTLKGIESAYNVVYPNNFFDVTFVDKQIEQQYETEQTMGKLINFFAIVAIFIGCLGLYGLVSFMVVQKIKEIGVRKVLGATEIQILSIFGKEFGKLIFIAFVIAAPLSWYVMNKWLQNYEYRTTIGITIFFWAVATSVFIASVTVGYQTLRAAWANPAKSLKSE